MVRKEKGRKRQEKWSEKHGGRSGEEKKEGKGKRQVFFTVLYCIDLCLFMILHYSKD